MEAKQKRTFICLILSVILLYGAYLFEKMAGWYLDLPRYGVLIPYVAVYLLVGFGVIRDAFVKLFHGKLLDESFLMTVATVGAFCLKEYPEAVFVMLFYRVGELFEEIAVNSSRRSITELMKICPEEVTVLREGEEMTVHPSAVEPGECIRVRAGEKIALDGIVEAGCASLNTAALTGESLPRTVKPGDAVVGGCLNLDGALEIRTTKKYEDSTVARILAMVEDSAQRKAKSESFISKFAKIYTPVVVGLAAALAVLPPLLGGDWFFWLRQGLTLLVISCPCAIVLSVPLTFFGSIGGAAKHGILIKGGNFSEILAKADAVAFDKTGTLTTGEFSVKGEEGHPRTLATAAAAERFSQHPIALSLKKAAGDVSDYEVSEFETVPGKGVQATVDNKFIMVGNPAMMEENHIAIQDSDLPGTKVYVAKDGAYMGTVVIGDNVKEDARQAVEGIRALGVKKISIVSGDSHSIVEAVAQELNITDFYGELLPDQKASCVREIQGTVAYVGDGINDVPVLSEAAVGISMGALGSDAAIEAADVVLMDDQPSKVALAMRLAKRTHRIVWFNIWFALIVKTVFTVLTAVGITHMGAAVFADVGVLVIAVLNAMRTLTVPKKYLR